MIYTIETLKAGLNQINQTMQTFIQGLLVAWIIQAVVCAILSANIAREKGYNSVIWAVTGLLFGIFSLFALMALPTRKFDKALPQIEADLKEIRFLLRRIEGHLDTMTSKPEATVDDIDEDEE